MGRLASTASRRLRGVLTALQERVALIVSALAEAEGFALAGGAALVVRGVIDRSTRDLDFFGPSADGVDRLVAAVERQLVASGMEVARLRAGRGFVRLRVVDGADVTEVDVAVDARIRPAELGPLGPTLSLEELAADKLLALFDRAQARDFIDVDALVGRLGLQRLCDLAAEKDAGFSADRLREALGTFDRFSPDDLGIDEPARQRLRRSVARWRDELSVPPQRKLDPNRRGPDLSL